MTYYVVYDLSNFIYVYYIKQLSKLVRNKSDDTKVILLCKRNLQLRFFFSPVS